MKLARPVAAVAMVAVAEAAVVAAEATAAVAVVMAAAVAEATAAVVAAADMAVDVAMAAETGAGVKHRAFAHPSLAGRDRRERGPSLR